MRSCGRPPGVRSRGGGGRAREDRDRAEREQCTRRPDSDAIGAARPLARLVPRAPGERDGGDQDQHREPEVGHHEAGSEVVAHGEAAEHGLGDDADREQHAEQRQVAPVGTPPEGQRAGGHGDQADDAGQQAVAVLDDRVGVRAGATACP